MAKWWKLKADYFCLPSSDCVSPICYTRTLMLIAIVVKCNTKGKKSVRKAGKCSVVAGLVLLEVFDVHVMYISEHDADVKH